MSCDCVAVIIVFSCLGATKARKHNDLATLYEQKIFLPIQVVFNALITCR